MNAARRELLASVLIAALWAAAPLYPSFVSLMPIAPPGLSLLPVGVCLAVLAAVVVSILGVLGLLVADGGAGVLRHPVLRAVWWYAGGGAVIGLLGYAPLVGILYGVFVACTGIGVAAILHWSDRPAFLTRMYRAMLWSSGLAACIALALWATRWPAQLYAVGNGRAIGLFVVPGELAGYFGMFLPFAVGIALTTRDRALRRGAAVSAVLQTAAMLASLSRAGLVGLALGAGLLLARRSRRLALGYGIILFAIAVTLGRHLFDMHHNPAEDTNRVAIWLAALRVIELYPLIGVGPGGFAHMYPLVRLPGGEPNAWHAHNLILATLAETGFLGFATLAFVWTRFALAVRKSFGAATQSGQVLATAIIAGFVGTWLQSSIDVVQILILGVWIPFMGVTLVALRAADSPQGDPMPTVRGLQNAPAARPSRRRSLIAIVALALTSCSQGTTGPTHASPAPVSVHGHSPVPASVTAQAVPSSSPATPSVTPIPPFTLHARREGAAPVSIMVMQGSRKLYTIDADSNETERSLTGEYRSSFADPKLLFFNRDGTKMRATASKADVDGASKVVTMFGNVHVYAQDGTTLTCDRLQYDDRTSHVEGWSNVVVTTKQGDILNGEHLAGDVHLQHIHIDGNENAP